ncbi:MAG: chemotaxis protein [Rhodospirillales bacterium CG15_BIG_FIL_POST_REV_8_21_14_020_66_15]|nr:MAG: chemotaxis protein [Rhodospirillales bacterium CG15_BIG_FIL_POST_REV_8_21_14_020_66_15]
MALYGKPGLTGHERTFDKNDIIVTKTDLSGKLTYVNSTFLRISGYSEQECLGQQHNLIRHPEMPRAVFELLWKTIQGGDEIFAYVNNRAKNGDNYWVLAHVTPSFDAGGNMVGYHSNRRVPDRDVLDAHIIPLYARLLDLERKAAGPREGLASSFQAVRDLLSASRMSFNQFMFSLGV